jgi:hypothetical protein
MGRIQSPALRAPIEKVPPIGCRYGVPPFGTSGRGPRWFPGASRPCVRGHFRLLFCADADESRAVVRHARDFLIAFIAEVG